MSKAIRDAAHAVGDHAKQRTAYASRHPRYAIVRQTDPVHAELTDSRHTLEEDVDLVLGYTVKQYDAQEGLEVGDTLAVSHMPGDHFLAWDVLNDLDPDRFTTIG